MQKTLVLITMAMSLTANAQNVQLHYNFGRHNYTQDKGERQTVATTFEHFKADRLGS